MQQAQEKVFDVSVFYAPWLVILITLVILAIFVAIYLKRDMFFGAVSFPVEEDEDTKKARSEKEEQDKHIPVVIALAINQYLEELNDYEKTILTIKKIIKPYTPWSSKIYGLRQTPQIQPRRK